jgi:hypothetical protein
VLHGKTSIAEDPNEFTEWEITDTYSSSGTHVSAPIFVASNLTWRFDMTLVSDTESVIIPLFINITRQDELASTGQVFDRHACTGYVNVCCLYEMNKYFINEELQSFLKVLGPCTALPHAQPTDMLLRDLAPTRSFVDYAFPLGIQYPRIWGVNENTHTLEILFEFLSSPWLTEEPTESQSFVLDDVLDREMRVVFAHVTPTPVDQLRVVLSDHTLIFHEATRHIDQSSNILHGSFFQPCANVQKPENALWRADILLLPVSCLWFCAPGFILYPSATDYYHSVMVPQTSVHGVCQPVPKVGAMVVLQLKVNITHNIIHNITENTTSIVIYEESTWNEDEYIAFVAIAIQDVLADAVGIERDKSTLYLQSVHSVPFNVTQTLKTLSISLVLYTNDTENNATVQENQVLRACVAPATASELVHYIDHELSTFFMVLVETTLTAEVRVVSVYTVMRYPSVIETLPFRDTVIIGVWASCMGSFICVALYWAFDRLGTRKRVKRRRRILYDFM